jgi:phosphatidylglycerophosphatase A
MSNLIKIAASGLGTGYIPFAPGTFGAILGLGVYWFLSPLPHYIYIPTVVAFVFLSVWVSSKASILYGTKDPQKINIDEIAGLLVTFIFHQWTIIAAVAGLVLFRIFDIAKPFPIRWVERRFPGGWGIVLDDVVAGIYANIALWIVLLIIGRFV